VAATLAAAELLVGETTAAGDKLDVGDTLAAAAGETLTDAIAETLTVGESLAAAAAGVTDALGEMLIVGEIDTDALGVTLIVGVTVLPIGSELACGVALAVGELVGVDAAEASLMVNEACGCVPVCVMTKRA
jgi:hypothetical protein